MISQSRHSLILPMVAGQVRRPGEGRTSLQDSLFSGRSCDRPESGEGAPFGASAPIAGQTAGRGKPSNLGGQHSTLGGRNFADPQWAEQLGQSVPCGSAPNGLASMERMAQTLPQPKFPWEPSLNSERGVYQRSFSVLAVHRWLAEWC